MFFKRNFHRWFPSSFHFTISFFSYFWHFWHTGNTARQKGMRRTICSNVCVCVNVNKNAINVLNRTLNRNKFVWITKRVEKKRNILASLLLKWKKWQKRVLTNHFFVNVLTENMGKRYLLVVPRFRSILPIYIR